ncbi:Smad nuclear-interacting protein 1 [Cytospora mali]|uniref:Smad nuclear-interacting protein 1 n=1 Tax=Cytospora mali TaxID=578113 RepID=A0A194W6N7_CYTMA|nr:Smad nuclear-interacting protein 1 [Valsa mali]
MGSDTHYDQADSDRRRRRHDDDYKDSSDRDRASKRSHRSRDEPESYHRRDRSKDRDQDRHRRRRRSRSPESTSHKSHDRRRRDSRSPVEKESRRDKRSRRIEVDAEEEGSTRSRRRRDSRSMEDSKGDEDRHRRRRRHRDASADGEDAAEKQVSIKRGGPLPSQADSFAVVTGEEPEKPKEKPNFGTTGALAAASNSVTQEDGTVITLKYHEPAEARKPPARDQWKLFVFKGQDVVDTVELSSRSCWLVGREAAVVDMPAEHPSISKQHAVIQFRYTEKRNEFGDKIGRVKPYLIDLESANGTELNGEKIPDRRYLELRPKDVVKFGLSTREYVVMLARD